MPVVYDNKALRQVYNIKQSNTSMTDISAGQWQFNLATATINNNGANVISVVDDPANTRTKFIALMECAVVVNISMNLVSAAQRVEIFINNVAYTMEGSAVYSTGNYTHGSASIYLLANEYFTFGASSAGSASGANCYLTFKASAI